MYFPLNAKCDLNKHSNIELKLQLYCFLSEKKKSFEESLSMDHSNTTHKYFCFQLLSSAKILDDSHYNDIYSLVLYYVHRLQLEGKYMRYTIKNFFSNKNEA